MTRKDLNQIYDMMDKLDKIYGLIKKDISSQIKEMSNDIDGMSC